jgi:heme oxygenase (biliverdin-producing, ferredoxin)
VTSQGAGNAAETLAAPGLAAALRQRTAALHERAERSGIVRHLLEGTASRAGYAMLLRNLWPAYVALEAALERMREAPGVRQVARRELYRAQALAADLHALGGPSWASAWPELEAARRYARCVEAAAEGDGARLVAHAYVRHLGDLSGGRILRERLRHAPGIGDGALAFLTFPGIADPQVRRAEYRRDLDRAGEEIAGMERVVEEAATAFAINIDLSEAVQAALGED